MSFAIAEMIATIVMVIVVGLFLVSIPITRRLGRVLEEWIRMRQEGAPDRGLLEDLAEEVRSLGRHVQALDDRVQFLADRQDFTESLVEARKTDPRALVAEVD